MVFAISVLCACEKVNVKSPVLDMPVYMKVNLMNEAICLDILGGYYEIYPMEGNRLYVNRSGQDEVLYNNRLGERYGYSGVVCASVAVWTARRGAIRAARSITSGSRTGGQHPARRSIR